jgi:hypothetical protein
MEPGVREHMRDLGPTRAEEPPTPAEVQIDCWPAVSTTLTGSPVVQMKPRRAQACRDL